MGAEFKVGGSQLAYRLLTLSYWVCCYAGLDGTKRNQLTPDVELYKLRIDFVSSVNQLQAIVDVDQNILDNLL